MDPALQGSLATGILGVVSLVVARIRCLYKRDEEGHCGPCVCGCTERQIQADHEEVDVNLRWRCEVSKCCVGFV